MNIKAILSTGAVLMISAASSLLLAQDSSSPPALEVYTQDSLLLVHLKKLYDAQTHLQVIKANYQAKETQRNLKISSFFPEPGLFLGYIPWRVGMPPIHIGISQKIPWPGQKTKLKKQLQSQSEQEALVLRAQYKAEALLLLKKLYALYEATKIEQLLEDQLRILDQEEVLIANEAKQISASGVQLLNLQAQREELEEKRLEVTDRAALLRVEISLQLRQDPEQIAAPVTLHLPSLNKDSLFHLLALRNTQLRAQEQIEQTQRAALSYQRSLIYPSPQLQLRYMTRETRNNTELQAPDTFKGGLFLMASMRLPVLGKRHRLSNQFEYQKLQIQQLEVQQLTEKLTLKLEKKWQAYDQNKRKVKLYDRLIKQNQTTATLLSSSDTSSRAIYRTQFNHLKYQIKRTKALRQAAEAAMDLHFLAF